MNFFDVLFPVDNFCFHDFFISVDVCARKWVGFKMSICSLSRSRRRLFIIEKAVIENILKSEETFKLHYLFRIFSDHIFPIYFILKLKYLLFSCSKGSNMFTLLVCRLSFRKTGASSENWGFSSGFEQSWNPTLAMFPKFGAIFISSWKKGSMNGSEPKVFLNSFIKKNFWNKLHLVISSKTAKMLLEPKNRLNISFGSKKMKRWFWEFWVRFRFVLVVWVWLLRKWQKIQKKTENYKKG